MWPDLTPEKIFDKWSELHDTDPDEVRWEEYIKTLKEFVEKVKEDGDSTLLIAYYDMVNARRKYQEMVKQSMKKLIPINKNIKK